MALWGNKDRFFNIANDPFAGTTDAISEYYHVQSVTQAGTYLDIVLPTDNFPVVTPTRTFLHLSHKIDVSDLGASRPIVVVGSVTGAFTRVTASPSAGEFRVSPSGSVYRNVIEINSANAGETISYDYYGTGSVITADYLNEWVHNTYSTAVNYTITDTDGYRNIIVAHSSSTGLLTMTLPTAADNKNRRIKVLNGADGLTKVDGEGAEVIRWKGNALTYVYLYMDGDYIDLVCDGVEWFVDSGYSHIEIGWQNRSDWSNVHIGNGVTYDNGSAASTKSVDWTGQKITEATSGITAIILEDTGGAGTSGIFYFYNVTGVGYFTNDRVLTAGNGETIDVNEGSGSSKNIDYNLFHEFGINASSYKSRMFISSTATFTTTQEVALLQATANNNNNLTNIWQLDTNSLKLQTGSNGAGSTTSDAGLSDNLDTDDVYTNIIMEFII